MPIMIMELGAIGLRLQRHLLPLTLAISLTHENTSPDSHQGPIFSFFLGWVMTLLGGWNSCLSGSKTCAQQLPWEDSKGLWCIYTFPVLLMRRGGYWLCVQVIKLLSYLQEGLICGSWTPHSTAFSGTMIMTAKGQAASQATHGS